MYAAFALPAKQDDHLVRTIRDAIGLTFLSLAFYPISGIQYGLQSVRSMKQRNKSPRRVSWTLTNECGQISTAPTKSAKACGVPQKGQKPVTTTRKKLMSLAVFSLNLLCFAGLGAGPAPAQPACASLASNQLAFEANLGQFSPSVLFVARGDRYTLYLTARAAHTHLYVRSRGHGAADQLRGAGVPGGG